MDTCVKCRTAPAVLWNRYCVACWRRYSLAALLAAWQSRQPAPQPPVKDTAPAVPVPARQKPPPAAMERARKRAQKARESKPVAAPAPKIPAVVASEEPAASVNGVPAPKQTDAERIALIKEQYAERLKKIKDDYDAE
jgi:hypothetical protein